MARYSGFSDAIRKAESEAGVRMVAHVTTLLATGS